MILRTLTLSMLILASMVSSVVSQESPPRFRVSAGNDVRFQRLTARDGLSHNLVNDIVQDEQGFMWFGTGDGLNRYDGYSFKVFRKDDRPGSLSGVSVNALFLDRSGRLWVGADEYLERYDPATESFIHYRPEPAVSGGGSGLILSICQDAKGMIWLATSKGLQRIDPMSREFTVYQHDPQDPSSLESDDLKFVMEDKGGFLWVVSSMGLDTFDPDTHKTTHYFRFGSDFEKAEFESLLGQNTRLYKGRSGELWIISRSGIKGDTGLATFDPKTRKLTQYSLPKKSPAAITVSISSILEDKDGVLWLGTMGSGLLRFDRRRLSITQYRNRPGVPDSLSNNFVPALYEDREGSIWVGTSGGGISRCAREKAPFRVYRSEVGNPHSLDQNYVISAYEDSSGILWIGNDKVLNRIDPKTGRYVFYRETPEDPIGSFTVTSTIEDRSRYLWFGTYGSGLKRFDRKTGTFKQYRNNPADAHSLSSDRVLRVFVDHAGTLWVGTGQGLDRFDPRTNSFARFHTDPPTPTAQIIEDREGVLWLASISSGFSRFDPATGHFTVFRHDPNGTNSLSNDTVHALCMDKSGTLWVGTDFGLNSLDPHTLKFTSVYLVKDGLASSAVQAIQEDDQGNLWLATDNGMSRFQPQTKTFKNYYDSDGLAGIDFAVATAGSFKSASGEMFFWGVDGVTAFYPSEVVGRLRNPYTPPVVLTDLRLKNASVPIDEHSVLKKSLGYLDKLVLSHEQNIFSLEFSALSYFNPAANHYRYKLEGLDSNWIETPSTRRLASYTTLPAGDYVFHVQARTERGAWNQTGASLRIKILPPWWGTAWFRTLCGLFVVAMAWSAYALRVRTVQRRNRQLTEQVEEATAELQAANGEAQAAREKAEAANQAKSAFLASVSHDLRTPLNGILGYVQILKKTGLTQKQVSGLDVIQQSGDHLLTLINDILELSRIEAGKMELLPADLHVPSFLSGIADIIRIKAEQKGLQFALAAARDLPEGVCADERRLRQVLLNLLDNAVKFTEHGRVTLQVDALAVDNSEARLRFEVSDTGVGMSAEQLGRIFQPFVQVGDIHHRAAGMGLGLAICRRLVKLMGGEIQVRSEPGQGTTFWFELALPLTAAIAKLPEVQLAVGYSGPRKKVLVVDDVPANRAILSEFLSTLGFEIAEAENGEEGLRRASDLHPDLILMDGVMPAMDGLEATRRLRQIPGCEGLPIIGISASASGSDAAAFLTAGANAFLTKPVAFAPLLAEVGTLMKIHWVYESQEAEPAKTVSQEELVLPPHEELAILHELAVYGDMSKIDARAEYLAALDERYRPLAAKLHQFAMSFQTKALLAFVDECIAGEHIDEPAAND